MNRSDLVKLKETIDGLIKDKAISDKILIEIASLPQIDAIKLEDADKWIKFVATDPTNSYFGEKQILWHVKRLNGFGGSEIGVLIAGDFDEHNAFSSPRDIVMAKLMIKTPERATKDTLRGNLLEDTFADEAIDKMKKKNGSDFKLIENPTMIKDPNHPWLIGNPDLVYDLKGKRVVNDYKIPNSDNAEHASEGYVKFDYVAQQHHYLACMMGETDVYFTDKKLGLIVYDFGIEEESITNMLEVGLSGSEEALENAMKTAVDKAHNVVRSESYSGKDNPYGASMSYIPIVFSEKMMQSIYDAGDKYYKMVLEGDVPDFKSTPKIFIDDEELLILSDEAAALKLTSRLLQERADAIQLKIVSKLGDMGALSTESNRDHAIQLGDVSMSKVSSKIAIKDTERATQLAVRLGVDPEVFNTVNKTILLKNLLLTADKEQLIKDGIISSTDQDRRINYPRKGSKLFEASVELVMPMIDDIEAVVVETAEKKMEDSKNIEKEPSIDI